MHKDKIIPKDEFNFVFFIFPARLYNFVFFLFESNLRLSDINILIPSLIG